MAHITMHIPYTSFNLFDDLAHHHHVSMESIALSVFALMHEEAAHRCRGLHARCCESGVDVHII